MIEALVGMGLDTQHMTDAARAFRVITVFLAPCTAEPRATGSIMGDLAQVNEMAEFREGDEAGHTE